MLSVRVELFYPLIDVHGSAVEVKIAYAKEDKTKGANLKIIEDP